MEVLTEKKGRVWTVIINRPAVKNAVDAHTARQLAESFRQFENDDRADVAVLYGAGGTFCAGADLRAFAAEAAQEAMRLNRDMTKDGPMGPSRMQLSKPVIAAIAGYAVAGGLELACWCDIRVVEQSSVFGVYCRRFGVPLIDGGTQRLPRLIGMSRAMDMILTGRPVHAQEALQMGLANYIVADGSARSEAERLAHQLTELPQKCMKSDRQAVYGGFDLPFAQAMALEFELGMQVVESGESHAGARRFTMGGHKIKPE
ncbi:MAG: crotonase/enoyl-CoA hydratase family protein [Desulfobacteraceae bacterium]|nr:MAG: crotonase/enoyl-CoA hydratase family protein [Desulfobacteraceae bacterium]